MKRGSVYWVNLEPGHQSEMGKVRPSLVISNSEQNLILNTVAVIPLSTQPPEIWPLRIELKISKVKKSYAVIPGVRQVSKKRFGEFICNLSPAQMAAISEALHVYLDE